MKSTQTIIFAVLFFCSIGFAYEPKNQPCSNGSGYPIHITFDDGPKLPNTNIVLDTLKKYKIKATFFVSASNYKFLLNKQSNEYSSEEIAMIEVLQRMINEGHIIASHSFEHIDHGDAKKYSKKEIKSNLALNYAIWQKLKIKRPAPFRFPYGGGMFPRKRKTEAEVRADKALFSSALNTIQDEGFVPTHWDIDTNDWSEIKRKLLPGSALTGICESRGGVILFHDVHESTVANLPAFIESVKMSGHQFVDYKEIRKYSDSRPKPLFSFKFGHVSKDYCKSVSNNVPEMFGGCPKESEPESDIDRSER